MDLDTLRMAENVKRQKKRSRSQQNDPVALMNVTATARNRDLRSTIAGSPAVIFASIHP